ncbi:MAG TPA: ABC transporter ATP-binding protein [Geminicoccus sp.]|jgi:phospholipid/cholesterol/gamma-HCH transport system ATP-binding protein|uniref:ABC transporter ATP-binding protein n=1 Tax=Geminicoccus sp. TaxID=2024832 RepID=UPI002E33B1E4|nr:ABC transporter ATP-binding protein [Geminicoccus sp.]HEX2526241.1 ABC transporter ATP-binding protein [Geminicoccus sp.]
MATAPPIEVHGLVTRFGGRTIHENLDLEVRPGEVLGVVGGSGAGKSVLMRTILGLMEPAAGTIRLLGADMAKLSGRDLVELRSRTGVLFQDAALFSTLTVAENTQVPLRERFELAPRLLDELACLKIALVGLPPDARSKYPSELSGGMRKRAGLARAIALDPDILFLDEPTAGLDPIAASAFDELILQLSKTLGLTVVMITHDLDSLVRITDRVAALIDRRCVVAPIDELRRLDDPWLQQYFTGPRGRAALSAGQARA